MNFTQEQLMIGKRLRDFSASWISSLRDSIKMFSTVPHTNPNHPLPTDFPFTTKSLREKVHWIEEQGGTVTRYAFIVHFEYHLDLSAIYSPAVWIVRSSTKYILGRVEVGYRILNDSDLPFTIDADYVLQMMLYSLIHEQPVQLASRVVPNYDPIMHQGNLANVQIFEVRSSEGHLVLEQARRMVATRICSICNQLLPPAGPDSCIFHLMYP